MVPTQYAGISESTYDGDENVDQTQKISPSEKGLIDVTY